MNISLRNGTISMNIEIDETIVDEVVVDGQELYTVRNLEKVSVLRTYKGENIESIKIIPTYQYENNDIDKTYEIFG